MDFIVFDYGDKTLDRYTIITEDGEMYGSSSYPYHPQGFGQNCGNAFQSCGWESKDFKKLKDEITKDGNLGRLVDFKNLPSDVQKYVNYVSENNLETNLTKFKREIEIFLSGLNYKICFDENLNFHTLILNENHFKFSYDEKLTESGNIPYFEVKFIIDDEIVSSKDVHNFCYAELYEPLNKMLAYKFYLPEWMKKNKNNNLVGIN